MLTIGGDDVITDGEERGGASITGDEVPSVGSHDDKKEAVGCDEGTDGKLFNWVSVVLVCVFELMDVDWQVALIVDEGNCNCNCCFFKLANATEGVEMDCAGESDLLS